MAEHVSDANTEVDEQDVLVTELMEALQGKSVPGGGSGSVETCTVNLTISDAGAPSFLYVFGTHLIDGVVGGMHEYYTDIGGSTEPLVFNDIIKDTIFTISCHGGFCHYGDPSVSNGEVVKTISACKTYAVKITGSPAVIDVRNIY